jgi:hypothetical protein
VGGGQKVRERISVDLNRVEGDLEVRLDVEDQHGDGQPSGLLGKDWRSRKGLPVVNVAGCAADADTMVLSMR